MRFLFPALGLYPSARVILWLPVYLLSPSIPMVALFPKQALCMLLIIYNLTTLKKILTALIFTYGRGRHPKPNYNLSLQDKWKLHCCGDDYSLGTKTETPVSNLWPGSSLFPLGLKILFQCNILKYWDCGKHNFLVLSQIKIN